MSVQVKLQLETESSSEVMTAAQLKPILEALIYVAEEPLSETALISIMGKEHQQAIREALQQLVEHYQSPECGLEIKEIANGFKMATKAEHHEWVRQYVKLQTPPTKLSLAALETLAVVAYKQPITVPEIQEVRGVNAVGVLKTLLDKKLITTAGRKSVIGRPILYRTTKEFLVHFGLKNLDELPSLEEFEELARSAVGGAGEITGEAASDFVQGETVSPDLQLEEAAGTIGDEPPSLEESVETAAMSSSRFAAAETRGGAGQDENVGGVARAAGVGFEDPNNRSSEMASQFESLSSEEPPMPAVGTADDGNIPSLTVHTALAASATGTSDAVGPGLAPGDTAATSVEAGLSENPTGGEASGLGPGDHRDKP